MPTNERNEGKVFGFVGVSGSGKDYNVSLLRELDAASKRRILTGDFSEGIRQTVMSIFLPHGEMVAIDPESKVYRDWKGSEFKIPLPVSVSEEPYVSVITGREILQNVGEGLKTLCGEGIWANWTSNYLLRQWLALPEVEKIRADVVFGSIRFDCEAEEVFRVASIMGKTVEIRFCDFRSPYYKVNDHKSEEFAKYFLNMGCKDGQNITNEVFQKIHGL